MAEFRYYQRGGFVDPLGLGHKITYAHGKIIAEEAGVPGVRMQITPGVGEHRRGLAIDVQAGRGNDTAHSAIAAFILTYWSELGVRYLAWGGTEWGGSWGGKERKRKQTTNYGGSDPWHKNHVHVDFRADAPVWAGPKDRLPVLSETIRRAQEHLTALGYYDTGRFLVDGLLGPATEAATRNYQRAVGLTVDGNLDPTTRKHLEDDMNKIDTIARQVAEAHRVLTDTSRTSFRTRTELTNQAVGRVEVEVRALRAAVATLANGMGLDPGLVQTTIEDAVDAALADLRISRAEDGEE